MKKIVTIIIIVSTLSIMCITAFAENTLPTYTEQKTGSGLANFAINAYNNNWVYAKGYYGQVVTSDNITAYANLYPEYYTQEMLTALQNHIGERASDCIGLVKAYMWQTENGIQYNADIFPDYNANMLFESAQSKGSITTLPDEPGVVLYDRDAPHIGIYIGNGMAIDNFNFQYGMQYKSVNEFDWDYWIKPEQITYNSYDTNTENTYLLFGQQMETIENTLGFLPDDIVIALMVIIVFVVTLGVVRIVL